MKTNVTWLSTRQCRVKSEGGLLTVNSASVADIKLDHIDGSCQLIDHAVNHSMITVCLRETLPQSLS